MRDTPALFTSTLMAEAVFERASGLCGATVELCAGCVPEMVRPFDWRTRIAGRVDKSLWFARTASEKLSQQMGVGSIEGRGRRPPDSQCEG